MQRQEPLVLLCLIYSSQYSRASFDTLASVFIYRLNLTLMLSAWRI